jgi:hypothetical protein
MTTRPLVSALLVFASTIGAQAVGRPVTIQVNPSTVRVNAQGATTVFLTFGGLSEYMPVEATWCGKLVSAAPAAGLRCDPATIASQSRATVSGAAVVGGRFTEAMSVSAAISRQAYQATVAGQMPGYFYYVRRFASTAASKAPLPDQYVAVICQLAASGGVGLPFTLTNVTLHSDLDTPVLFVPTGATLSPLRADLQYTGTGRLRGRWEIVLPGVEWPSAHDLLTEGSLPVEERGLQRRYTELERFNVLLLPNGRYTLPGPNPKRLPTAVDGTYLLLLRIEASDDKASDTNLGAFGAAGGVVHNGASAGFPMPTLRYVVGRTGNGLAATQSRRRVPLLLPLDGASVAPDSGLMLSWGVERGARNYRVEIEGTTDGTSVLSAIVGQGTRSYDVPPFARTGVTDGRVRWRVIALDESAREIRHSEWRSLRFIP